MHEQLDERHDGLLGEHTVRQADGAWPNGSRVEKRGSLPGDTHQDGAPARVVGSVGVGGMLGYFVEWDDAPGYACFVAGVRLRRRVT